MEWNHLHWVARLARSGSVAVAARSLGVAPSTLYRRLDKLEAELGLSLFDRRQGGLRPTDAGRIALSAAEDLEVRLARMDRELADLGSEVSGRVVVAVPEALALVLLEPLATLRIDHPAVSVELRVSSEHASMARGEADVAVRVSADPGDTLIGRRVGRVEVAVFGTTASTGPFDPADHDWVCFDASLGHTAQARWEREHVPTERVRMRLASRTLFLEAVAAGVGVGLLPTGLGARRPGLVRLSEPFGDESLTLWVLCHPSVRDQPAVRVVMDLLLDALKQPA